MPYNSNKAYGNNSVSYNFSSSTSGFSGYASTPNQMEYSNRTTISYSGNPNINYNNSLISYNIGGSGNGLGNNRNYVGNASRKGLGMGKGGGSGGGAGRGKGMGSGRGGRSGGRGVGQACIKMLNKFREDQGDKFQSDDADLAINKIRQIDLGIKIQKNHLDIIIEKLEEKNRKRNQKKQSKGILKEK